MTLLSAYSMVQNGRKHNEKFSINKITSFNQSLKTWENAVKKIQIRQGLTGKNLWELLPDII